MPGTRHSDTMSADLSKYACATVPRYTSYPPATQFHSGIGERHYRQWLGGIAANDRLSLYIHIPFCRQLCWYCGCHTTVANKEERIGDYAESLLTEIKRVGELIDQGARVAHLHFGGGTPNILPPEMFRKIVSEARRTFRFDGKTETAVEIDPRYLSDAHIEAFMDCQVTRASLGVQDVSPDVQALINRHQPIAVVRSAVERLRRAGVAAINLDLMYGLPGQTVDHIRRSVKAAAELAPDRLTVFGYAHVPWFKKNQRAIDERRLPDTAERMAQAKAAAHFLREEGFIAIGLDHFARSDDALTLAQRSGKLFRNFQGYTVDSASSLIGFGASSISSFQGGYVQNEPHLGRYRSAIAEGGFAIVRGVATSREDKLRRAVIERLMCDFFADVPRIRHQFDFDGKILSDGLTRLISLQEDGLVEVEGEIIKVTVRGRPFVRNIAACFDAYLGHNGKRHSLSI